MKVTKLMAAAVAATILITGCSKEESLNTPQNKNDRALNVTGGIQGSTRAYDTMWEANDAIGIYMLADGTTSIIGTADNRKYTTTAVDNRFNPERESEQIEFPENGSNTDFMAYYPWQMIRINPDSKYLYQVYVGNQTSQRDIDLMAADKVTGKNKNNTSVNFTFTHKLVKIVLTEIIPGEGITAADLQGLNVKLTNQRTRATYDVVNGGAVVVNNIGSATNIDFLVAANGKSAEAIVLPATSTAGMELVFSLNGTDYKWALSNATNSSSFEASKKYIYRITISKKGLNVTSSINDWAAGNNAGENGTAE